MTIYILYYFFIILFYYMSSHTHISNNRNLKTQFKKKIAYSGRNSFTESIYINISIIMMIIILGLRSPSMGVDLPGYISSYSIIKKVTFHSVINKSFLNYEKGFLLLMKVCGLVSENDQFLLFVCSAISLFPLAYLWKKYSRNTLMSIIVFLGTPIFLIYFSGLRQGIAIGIVCIAYEQIISKRPIRFVSLIILSSFFHTSALLFIIAYPIYWISLNEKIARISIVLLPLSFALRFPLFSLLAKLWCIYAILAILHILYIYNYSW